MRARYEYEFVSVPRRRPRDVIRATIRSRAEEGWRLVQVLDSSRSGAEIVFERPLRHDIDEVSDLTAVPI